MMYIGPMRRRCASLNSSPPELGDSRILLVGTYRATELSRLHPLSNALGSLARAPHFARLNLTGLSAEEVQNFIASAGTTAPAGLAKTLHDQTEGNPLFLREIVRFLEQRGASGRAGRCGTGPATGDPHPGGGDGGDRPPSQFFVRGLQRGPFAGFGDRAATSPGRWLLRAAAPLSEDMLLEALDEAVAAHIVEETAAGRYQFTHNLIRMTLYDELRIARRRQFHRAVGNANRSGGTAPSLTHSCLSWRAISRPPAMMPTAIGRSTMPPAPVAAPTRCSPSRMAVQFFQTALGAIEQQTEPDEAARCPLLFSLGEAQRKSNDFRKCSYDPRRGCRSRE